MRKTKCRAKDPSTCPYHGTIEHHTVLYKKANLEYLAVLRNYLQNSPLVSRGNVDEAKTRFEYARSLVDAHDKNFKAISKKVAELGEKVQTGHAALEQEVEYKDLVARYRNAENIRNRKLAGDGGTEGWSSGYVRNMPNNVLLENGEKVVSVHRIPRMGAYRDLVVENSKGEVRVVRWNSNTKVNFKELTPVHVENDEDPWGPAGK